MVTGAAMYKGRVRLDDGRRSPVGEQIEAIGAETAAEFARLRAASPR